MQVSPAAWARPPAPHNPPHEPHCTLHPHALTSHRLTSRPQRATHSRWCATVLPNMECATACAATLLRACPELTHMMRVPPAAIGPSLARPHPHRNWHPAHRCCLALHRRVSRPRPRYRPAYATVWCLVQSLPPACACTMQQHGRPNAEQAQLGAAGNKHQRCTYYLPAPLRLLRRVSGLPEEASRVRTLCLTVMGHHQLSRAAYSTHGWLSVVKRHRLMQEAGTGRCATVVCAVQVSNSSVQQTAPASRRPRPAWWASSERNDQVARKSKRRTCNEARGAAEVSCSRNMHLPTPRLSRVACLPVRPLYSTGQAPCLTRGGDALRRSAGGQRPVHAPQNSAWSCSIQRRLPSHQRNPRRYH